MSDEQPQVPPPAPPVRQTDKLAEALAAAQGEYRPVKRTKTVKVKIKPEKGGGTYSFKYAPLDECIAATRPALSKHGLAVVQVFQTDPLRIVTTLLHSSGQYAASTLPLRGGGTDQDFGGEQTYKRRYSYAALVGISADEDTDGPPPPGADEYTHGPAQSGAKPPLDDKPGSPSKAQLKRLFAIAKSNDWSTDQLKAKLLLDYRLEHTADLTIQQYNELCGNARTKTKGLLEAGPPADEPPSEPPSEKVADPPGAPGPEPGTEAGPNQDGGYAGLAKRILDAQNAGDSKALLALAVEVGHAELTDEDRKNLTELLEGTSEPSTDG